MLPAECWWQSTIQLDGEWVVMGANRDMVLGSRVSVVSASLPKDPVLVSKHSFSVFY